jgi:hypothetical protein
LIDTVANAVAKFASLATDLGIDAELIKNIKGDFVKV